MKAVDVSICPTSTSLTHTNARRTACAAGGRVGTMPGITEDILIRTMKADYKSVAKRTYKVAELLTNGKMAMLLRPPARIFICRSLGLTASHLPEWCWIAANLAICLPAKRI
ncbi:MAG: hypothetical protein R3C26_08675 [Calditrichia bacterium]